MDRTITTSTGATPERLHEIVADLTTYPDWLDLVTRVEPTEPAGSDRGPAFLVTLRAKVGPLARNKRLRMVRVDSVAPVSVRFERSETDGRNHSQWVMSSDVAPADIGSELTMRLVYQGQFWDGLLDTVLGGVIDDAVPGLKAYADR